MGCGKSSPLPVHEADDIQETELARPPTLSVDGIVAVALKQKRKANVIIFGESAAPVDVSSTSRRLAPKPDELRASILQTLRDNVFFAEFGVSELNSLIDAMEPKQVQGGTTVIKQGDAGDFFYVIQHGKFEIVVGDRKVADWGDGTKNRTFGELALLYNLPRAATVRAVTDSALWTIDRATFRGIILHASQAQAARLRAALRRGILEDLSDPQLEALTAAATIVKYNRGDQIVRRGEEGEVFFIIEQGSVICKNLPGDQSNNILTAGDYFGERALLLRCPRAADVEALTDVSLIALHREDFEAHLGHLRELLQYNAGMRLLLCMPLVGALAEDARAELFSALSVASYNDGAIIAAQGRRCESFFIVKDAAVAVRQTGGGSPAAAAPAVPLTSRGSGAMTRQTSWAMMATSSRTSIPAAAAAAPAAGGTSSLASSSSRTAFEPAVPATPRGMAPLARGFSVAVPSSGLQRALSDAGGDGNSTPMASASASSASAASLRVRSPPARGLSSGGGGGGNSGTETLGLLHPGHWFPDAELDADVPLQASYVARGETQVFVLDREVYLRLVGPVKRTMLAENRLRQPPGNSSSGGGGVGAALPSTARPGAESTARLGAAGTSTGGGSSPAGFPAPRVPASTPMAALSGKNSSSEELLPATARPPSLGAAKLAGGSGEAVSRSSSQHPADAAATGGAGAVPTLPPSGGGGASRYAAAAAADAPAAVGSAASSAAGSGGVAATAAAAGGGAAAAGAPGGAVPARPVMARRFSSDYVKPAPPAGGSAASGTGNAAAAAAASTTLPAPVRKRLGIPMKDLELKKTLGTGTFGRVRLAVHRRTNGVFALKMLQKTQIVALKQQKNILAESNILWRIDHPFIIKLYDTYKDRDRLYMLLEVVQGGELFSRLQNSPTPGRIRPDEARFYAACVLDAFEYIHAMRIVYRDLKPENLLIDSTGYLKLVDFGFAKHVPDRTYTLCGTPEYLAPELVLGRGHDKGVDYWAVGILLFEQVAGYSPFADRLHNDQMVICKNILKGTVDFPTHFKDKELQNLVLQLLTKDLSKRLGCMRGGAADVKAHPFFTRSTSTGGGPLEWDVLKRREVPPPWRPKLANALDTSNFDDYDENDKVAPYVDDGSGWDATF